MYLSVCLIVDVCLESEEDISEKSVDEETLRSTLEELTEVQFQFEVKTVCSSHCFVHTIKFSF